MSVTATKRAAPPNDFAVALIEGLSLAQKSIPSRFFYDKRGSDLFEEITRLPEYYQTNTEFGILQDHRFELGRLVKDAALIELGSGSSRKTEVLLKAGAPALYLAIDVSAAALSEAMRRVAARHPHITLIPIVADFTDGLELPSDLQELRKVAFFPGSTIGNFEPHAARHLLQSLQPMLRDGHLLIGVDVPNAPDIMRRAYNDSAGVTAQFNLNLLRRANREFGADFDLACWDHLATYDEALHRIDMWLVSRRRQRVRVCDTTFTFAPGERIHTELSQKYAPEDFQTLAESAGFTCKKVWLRYAGGDASGPAFSMHLLAS